MLTVVMPSYLGAYRTAAKNREEKFIRAVQSVIENIYKEWELIVVADGCKKTAQLIKNFTDKRIKLIEIDKQPLWSGVVRNRGIEEAKYDYICYLDTDDMFGEDHLQTIADNISEYEWVWFNELSYDQRKESFIEKECDIHIRGLCGTSNVAHKKHLARWNKNNDYGQDWQFIKNLKKASIDFTKIETPSYLICHVPGLLDV